MAEETVVHALDLISLPIRPFQCLLPHHNKHLTGSKDETDHHTHVLRNDGHSAHPFIDNGDASTAHLQHLQWRPLMNKIPKALRAQCATAFSEIIAWILADPSKSASWADLFTFAPTILTKPSSGGANRNLANVVPKRLTECKDNLPVVTDLTEQYNKRNTWGQDTRLVAAITSKLEAGNFQAAVCLLCSDDGRAPTNAKTLKALRTKHPPAPHDRKPTPSPIRSARFEPLQVCPDDVMKCLWTFPAGLSGGPDGLTAQHLIYMVSSASTDKRKNSLMDFVNLLVMGELPVEVREILYGGRLIALQKKDGGIRPIAVDYTLRQLAAKCVNKFVIQWRSEEMQPIQVSVDVSGGAEAAVHAVNIVWCWQMCFKLKQIYIIVTG